MSCHVECFQSNSNFTTVIGHLYGFENQSYSERGFHVHENGSIGGNCTAAGNHYNPLNNTHGGPTDAIRLVVRMLCLKLNDCRFNGG